MVKFSEFYGVGEIDTADNAKMSVLLEDIYQKLATGINTNSDPEYLLSPNGYTYLFGGLLLQWGSTVVPITQADFTFPKPFTSPPFCITTGDTNGLGVAIVTINLNNVRLRSTSGTKLVYVLAIGI